MVGIAAGATDLRAQMQCRGGTIAFYPEGDVKSCEIEGIHTLHTGAGWIKCASGETMVRHHNGSLESCTLYEARPFGPQICADGSRVHFNADGTFKSCDE